MTCKDSREWRGPELTCNDCREWRGRRLTCRDWDWPVKTVENGNIVDWPVKTRDWRGRRLTCKGCREWKCHGLTRKERENEGVLDWPVQTVETEGLRRGDQEAEDECQREEQSYRLLRSARGSGLHLAVSLWTARQLWNQQSLLNLYAWLVS